MSGAVTRLKSILKSTEQVLARAQKAVAEIAETGCKDKI